MLSIDTPVRTIPLKKVVRSKTTSANTYTLIEVVIFWTYNIMTSVFPGVPSTLIRGLTLLEKNMRFCEVISMQLKTAADTIQWQTGVIGPSGHVH